jgi:hypothetical protein
MHLLSRLLGPLVGRHHRPTRSSILGTMIALDDDPITLCGCDGEHTC